MKKFLLPILIIALTTSCSDLIEKELKIYENAIEELDSADDFLLLMDEAIATERAISQARAKTSDEKLEKLKEDYGSDYDTMLDSVKSVRDSYYRMVDKRFLGYTYNFIERRTLLYNKAADYYCIAEYIEELDAIKKIIKRYSELSYVDGQRSCDPPARIREEYEAAKELAENCYNVAKTRILERTTEESEKR